MRLFSAKIGKNELTRPYGRGFSGDVQMDKNAKQAKAAKAKAEEAALNRILCWIVGGTVLWALTLLLNRYIVYYRVSEYSVHLAVLTAVKFLAVGGLVCAAAAGYWWKSLRAAGKKSALPGGLCLFLVGLSAVCFAAWLLYDIGLKISTYAVPAVVILALVAHLYQREFFLICCQSVLALLGTWLCGRGLGGGYAVACYAYVAVAAALCLLIALLCRKAQAGQGLVEWKGKSLRLFGKDANYALLYTGAAVALGVLIVSLFGVPTIVLYGAVAAWLLIMAVYYTVKLM